MEKGLNVVLIDQLYFSGTPPNNYQEYKQKVVDTDNMCKRQEANHGKKIYQPKVKDPNDMEIDNKGTNEIHKCFSYNKPGHLARNCPDKEKKQDF
jgi:hypothetical protein